MPPSKILILFLPPAPFPASPPKNQKHNNTKPHTLSKSKISSSLLIRLKPNQKNKLRSHCTFFLPGSPQARAGTRNTASIASREFRRRHTSTSSSPLSVANAHTTRTTIGDSGGRKRCGRGFFSFFLLGWGKGRCFLECH
jgi:hypothetical protein